MTMIAKHQLLSSRNLLASVAVLAAASALVACGGSKGSPSYPGGAYDQAAPQAYPQPAGTPAGESESFSGADDDGAAFEPRADAAGAPPPPAPSPGQAPTAKSSRREGEGRARDSADPFFLQEKPRERPGLATSFGERRTSHVTSAPFVRAERMNPFAVTQLFYNDPAGIQAMSDSLGGVRQNVRRFAVDAGHVEVALRDGSGHFLTGFTNGGNSYITAVAGRRYTIVVKNHSPGRIEALVSVDGLDVIDGKDASFSKRGYLLDPHGDLEIDGFRTSTTEVAAFRFGSVSNSYAAKKHGSTRNVGVIGVALFHEQGDSPRNWGTPRSHEDVVQRQNADAFPNRFATPPN
jgi:hypothetical protein